jgi:hypothetical protein
MLLACMRPTVPLLQMHTVVDQPLTAQSRGRISCRPIGLEPIDFAWTGPDGREVATDATGSEATNVAPGRYRVVAVDATGARADVVLDVEPMFPSAVVVQSYEVTPASTSAARDGAVTVVGVGVEDEGWRFLWTHGAVTDGPVLRDVPCGVYAAVAVAASEGGAPPTVVHLCAPARVGVGR